MSSRMIILWSQGSVDIVWLDKIASIRVYQSTNRLSVNVNTVDRLRISFDFYDKGEFFKLPAIIKHAEKYNFDVIIDLKHQKIYESKNGVVIMSKNEKQS